MNLRLDDPDPRPRDLAYLLFLEELLGGEWVERWARERGKLDTLREWRKVARPTPFDAQGFTLGQDIICGAGEYTLRDRRWEQTSRARTRARGLAGR